MFKRLVKSAVNMFPMSIKKAGWQYLTTIANDLNAERNQLPYHELSEQHIQNTELLANRDHLLKRLAKGAVVAEIGVDQGDFSDQILSVCQPEKFHLIDIWGTKRYDVNKEMQVRNRFETMIQAGQVEINKGLSTTILPRFDDHYFDWIYIDSDHSYQTTSTELRIAREKVKTGGVICGHDYAVGNWQTHYRYGVIEAVHEFCVTYNWEIIYLTAETHQFRSFALREIQQ